jgi:hypothetical protein
MLWTNLSKAFEQFRRWSAFKTLLELAGVWKWIALGASAVMDWTLPSFSSLDPAWRVLVALVIVVLALMIALFCVALRKVTRPEPPAPSSDQQQLSQTDTARPRSKPKKHQVALASVLVVLAIIGAIWGPKSGHVNSASSVTEVNTEHPPGSKSLPKPPVTPPDRQIKSSQMSPKSPSRTDRPTYVAEQHNEPGSTGYQAVGPNAHAGPIYGPVEYVLSDEEMKVAKDTLGQRAGRIKLILPSTVPNMGTDDTTALGAKMLQLFSGWSPDSVILGSGPIPPGITIMGDAKNEAVKTVIRAFAAAHIPYKLAPMFWTGPGGPGAPITPPDVEVAVTREVYIQSSGNGEK